MLPRRVIAMIVLSLLFSMTCRQAQAAPGKHLLIETEDGDDGDNGDQDPLSEENVDVYRDYQHPGHQDPMRWG